TAQVEKVSPRPIAEKLADLHDLAEMVGVMIGDQKNLAQVRATFSVRDHRGEISAFFLHEPYDGFQVGEKGGDRSGPLLRRRALLLRRPITTRPFRRYPRGIERVAQDVLLSDPQVLQLLPDRMQLSVGAYVTQLGRDVGQRAFRGDM